MLHKYDNIYGAFVNDIMNPTHKTIALEIHTIKPLEIIQANIILQIIVVEGIISRE